MSISAAHLSTAPSVTSTTPLPAEQRRHYTLIALGALAVLPAGLNAFNVLHNPAHSDAAIYGFASLCYLAAASSQRILLQPQGSAALRIRWHLWVSFLLLNAVALLLTFFQDKGLLHLPRAVSHILFSLGYALAYIVTVNPPRSTAWRRLWLVDAVLASVMGIMFFLVFRSGEPAGIYTSLLFTVAMQVLFALGSLLSLRTAESTQARDLARYMLVYFLLNTFSAAAGNLPRVWPRLSLSAAGDVTYAIATAGLALMPLIMQRHFTKRLALRTLRVRPLPPAAPVLITAAILLACIPLLHFNLVTGIALLIVAVGLFALKVALMQTDFEHERTSLLQSNKQLRDLAYIDPVTGIANRRSFMETARNALGSARTGFGPYWLVLFELEDLRSIFANSGRRAGELYLCEFTQLVRNTLQPSPAHFAHIANGEFALLLERVNQQTTEETVQRLRDALPPGTRLATGTALAASSGPDTAERWLANAGTSLHRLRASEREHNPLDV